MFGEIQFDHLPVFELLYRGKVVLEDGTARCLDGEFQDERRRLVGVLPHFRMCMHALIAHHLEERVGRRDADAADVVLRVARVDAGRAVEGLRHGTGRFYTGDGRRRIDAETLRVGLIGLHRHRAHLAHHRCLTHRGRIPLAGDGDAEQTLLLTIFLPVLRDVIEIRERGLVRAEQGRELRFAKKSLFRVVRARYHFGEIAELLRL